MKYIMVMLAMLFIIGCAEIPNREVEQARGKDAYIYSTLDSLTYYIHTTRRNEFTMALSNLRDMHKDLRIVSIAVYHPITNSTPVGYFITFERR